MFAIGDIVEIFSPMSGYKKYHLCIADGSDGSAAQFLFLNSDPRFAGTYVVDCARVPCLPPSQSGKTAFSFNIVPRYSARQLALYKAKKLGVLDKRLAAELLQFAQGASGLNRAEKAVVCAALHL